MSRIARLLRDNALVSSPSPSPCRPAPTPSTRRRRTPSPRSRSARHRQGRRRQGRLPDRQGHQRVDVGVALRRGRHGEVRHRGERARWRDDHQHRHDLARHLPGQPAAQVHRPRYACAADADTNTTYTGRSAAGIDLTGTSFGLKACPKPAAAQVHGSGIQLQRRHRHEHDVHRGNGPAAQRHAVLDRQQRGRQRPDRRWSGRKRGDRRRLDQGRGPRLRHVHQPPRWVCSPTGTARARS